MATLAIIGESKLLRYISDMVVTTFYRFIPFNSKQIEDLKNFFENLAPSQDFSGLVLLGNEGINGTVCGTKELIEQVKEKIRSVVNDPDQVFKDSETEDHPFHEIKVKVKKEIVTLGRPDLIPDGKNHHLTPSEWHQMMDQEDVIVLDTRNDYETKIGKFKNAKEMDITDFHDFPIKVKEMKIPKDKKILMYCTGGIRCEKALLEMNDQGYSEVYQLDGGILNYLKQYPNQKFEGECFVFDYRVAVDQELAPSKSYRLCPHCGQPSNNLINCVKCGTEAHVCESCLKVSEEKKTCSKNCAHHYRIASRSKKPQTEGFRHRPRKS